MSQNVHRLPAEGGDPGNTLRTTDPRSEGTPHHLRVSDIDHGPSDAVFLQNTPLLSYAALSVWWPSKPAEQKKIAAETERLA